MVAEVLKLREERWRCFIITPRGTGVVVTASICRGTTLRLLGLPRQLVFMLLTVCRRSPAPCSRSVRRFTARKHSIKMWMRRETAIVFWNRGGHCTGKIHMGGETELFRAIVSHRTHTGIARNIRDSRDILRITDAVLWMSHRTRSRGQPHWDGTRDSNRVRLRLRGTRCWSL